MEFMQATNGVSVETELQWRKILKSCNNPLGLSEEMVYESLDLCPPQNFKGARHIGRYLIPRSVFRYNEEEQPRDKNNDPDHVNNLLNDYLSIISDTKRSVNTFFIRLSEICCGRCFQPYQTDFFPT